MILIASALFPPEPVVSANLSFDLASTLGNDEDVVVVTPKPTRPYGMIFDTDSEIKKPYQHVVLDSYTCPESRVLGRVRESLSFGRKLEEFIYGCRCEIEVIYANVWPVFAQKLLANISHKYNIPLVMHVQDIYPESLTRSLGCFEAAANKLLIPIDRDIARKTKKIITISHQMKSHLVETRGVDASDVLVVRNWQDDTIFSEFKAGKRNAVEDTFCYAFLGSINPTAGVDFLIHCFGSAGLANTRLLIAGDGPDKSKCQKIAGAYDCDIQFVSVLPKEVPAVQSKADVLIMPLKKGAANTALPSKMTAYMFSAKPIIALVDSDSESARIIDEADGGWVVEPDNRDEMIRCIREVRYMNRDQLVKKGENACQYAKENLSKEKNLRLLCSIVKENKRVL